MNRVTDERARCIAMSTLDGGVQDLAADLLDARAEIAKLRADLKLMEHKVIVCGVAAWHPDPNVTTGPNYPDTWQSPQADKVRELRADRDKLRAEVEERDAAYQSVPTEAYADRNQAALAFAKLAMLRGWRVGLAVDPKEPHWPLLYVDTPMGQVSWHLPKAEVVGNWPEYSAVWDGHSVGEKRRRLTAMTVSNALAHPRPAKGVVVAEGIIDMVNGCIGGNDFSVGIFDASDHGHRVRVTVEKAERGEV